MGAFDIGVKIAEELIQLAKKNMNINWIIDGIIAKSENLICLGKLNDSNEILIEADSLLKEIKPENLNNIKSRKAYLSFLKGRIYYEKSKPHESLPYFKEAIDIRRDIEDRSGLMWALMNYGISQREIGEFLIAKPFLEESLGLAQEFKSSYAEIWTSIHLGWISYHLHDIEKALNYANNALHECLKVGNIHAEAMIYELMGFCYFVRGEFNETMNYFNYAIAKRKLTGYKNLIAQTYYSIGNVYSRKGEFKRAIEYYEKALSYPEVNDSNKKAAFVLGLGKAHAELGNYELAQKYTQESLSLIDNLDESVYISFSSRISTVSTLYYLIVLFIKQRNLKDVDKYLKKLEDLTKNYPDSKYINQLYRLTKAVILKSKSRLMDKMLAGNLLREIINEDVIDYEITVDAMINLCELLLFELEMTGDTTVLEEIKDISSELVFIAESHFSFLVLVESYFFQAKLALIELDTSKARILLTTAQRIAEDHNLKDIASRISYDHDSLIAQLDEWEQRVHENIPIQERLKLTQYEFLFSKMLRNKVDQIPESKETPEFFLISKKLGICAYFHDFSSHMNDNNQIIAGYISAINEFGKEAFAANISIDRIKYGEYTILIRVEQDFLFAFAIKGQSYFAMKKLDHFVKELHKKYDLDSLFTIRSNILLLNERVKEELDQLSDQIFLSK